MRLDADTVLRYANEYYTDLCNEDARRVYEFNGGYPHYDEHGNLLLLPPPYQPRKYVMQTRTAKAIVQGLVQAINEANAA